MYLQIIVFCLAFFVTSILSNTCPQGGVIYDIGISTAGKARIVDLHNGIRRMVANGTVPGQPRGINLKTMIYDEALGSLAKTVSAKCEFKTSTLKDDRYGVLGQNLYARRSSGKLGDENWLQPVKSWYGQHENFNYPNLTTSTGAYTQMVWATSFLIGCDYIHFYDETAKKYPFTEMYNCLYAPAGNIEGREPYRTGDSGCEDLC